MLGTHHRLIGGLLQGYLHHALVTVNLVACCMFRTEVVDQGAGARKRRCSCAGAAVEELHWVCGSAESVAG